MPTDRSSRPSGQSQTQDLQSPVSALHSDRTYANARRDAVPGPDRSHSQRGCRGDFGLWASKRIDWAIEAINALLLSGQSYSGVRGIIAAYLRWLSDFPLWSKDHQTLEYW